MNSTTLKLFLALIFGILLCPIKSFAKNLNDISLKNGSYQFIENKGQLIGEESNDVHFYLIENGLTVFLMNNRIAYQFEKREYTDDHQNNPVETYRMDLELVDANPAPQITTKYKSEDYSNYYNHNVTGVYGYQEVTYHNVYSNIDWVVYLNNGHLKYDFVVRPGGDPSQIKLKAKWVESLRLNPDGGYTISCLLGTITEKAPVSFQDDSQIETSFSLDKDVLTFNIGDYDVTSPLRIDPNVVWSTYYGGTDIDYGNAVAYDSKGNIYLAGDTKSTTNIASGGHQNTYGGTYYDAMLVKFNNKGDRKWATYFGGSGEDRAFAVATDGVGSIYIAGHTRSTSGIHYNGFKSSLSGVTDAFLVKFSSLGTRLWGTYYGLGGLDDAKAIAVDKSNNVYLSGSRKTTNYSGYFSKFDASGKHQWYRTLGSSTFSTYSTALCLDENGNIFIGGYTYLSSGISKNGHQNTYGGSGDAYLVKYNDKGTLQWGTYYGGAKAEFANSIESDLSGNLYLVGSTESTSGIDSSGHQSSLAGARDGFVVKFSNSGVRQWATYYGGSGNEVFNSVATDTAQNVYLVGNTASTSGIASNGIQNSYGGGNQDAFLVKLDRDGKRVFGTYYGGNDLDYGKGVSVDDEDNIYLVGYTLSKSFYGKNGHQNSFSGNRDAYLAKISQCTADPGVDVQTACDSYKWIDGKTYATSTNTPQFTITSSNGCDSLVTLNLTINNSPKRTYNVNNCGPYTVEGKTYSQSGTFTYNKANGSDCDSIITLKLTITKINKDVVVNGSTLTAVESSGTYQWLNCSDLTAIPNETRRSYKATENGEYAVEISINNCVDTSDCTNVKPVGIDPLNALSIQVYPNPSSGIVHLSFDQHRNINIKLYNMAGEVVFEDTGINSPYYRLHKTNLQGVFILKVSNAEGVTVTKLIME